MTCCRFEMAQLTLLIIFPSVFSFFFFTKKKILDPTTSVYTYTSLVKIKLRSIRITKKQRNVAYVNRNRSELKSNHRMLTTSVSLKTFKQKVLDGCVNIVFVTTGTCSLQNFDFLAPFPGFSLSLQSRMNPYNYIVCRFINDKNEQKFFSFVQFW